jgi:hypothetical protein
MIAETRIGYLNEILVKPGLVFTFFVPSDKHNGLLKAVECESETP